MRSILWYNKINSAQPLCTVRLPSDCGGTSPFFRQNAVVNADQRQALVSEDDK